MVVGRMVREGAWAVCVCISCTGAGGQLGGSFLWGGRGGGARIDFAERGGNLLPSYVA
jgi:hypothetical protein